MFIGKKQTSTAPYVKFNRQQWAKLRASVPIGLTDGEIARIKGVNEDLSLKEVTEIYFPLSCLLNFYYSSNLCRQAVPEQFFSTDNQCTPPYIISISGSVAVGKSTTARILQTLLSRWPEHCHVELIATDGFLYTNQVLEERNIMKKKGFPQSYDMHRLLKSISDIKSGAPNINVPIYSHLIYDVIPGISKIIDKPDILILEGLNILQNEINCYHDTFVSDFVDFSIYIDASEYLLKNWYVNRFLKFREEAFANPYSYFHSYSCLTKKAAVKVATSLWKEINYTNLKENILPTRKLASLILTKRENHIVDQIMLRR